MKRLLSLILALVMSFSLCACGKSDAVKNAEALIDAIGDITVNSGDSISLALDAYNALTAEEKAKVENLATLTSSKVSYVECLIEKIGSVSAESEADIVLAETMYNALSNEEKLDVENSAILTSARESYEYILKVKALAGDWCILTNPDSKMSFFEDGKVDFAHEGTGTFELTENGVRINLGIQIDYTYSEVEGFNLLVSDIGGTLVRGEDYDALYNMVFVEVDLANADINQYAEFTPIDYYVDDFGEKHTANRYLITSRVYDEGLIFWRSSFDTAVEYDGTSTMMGGFPFGQSCTTPSFGRIAGKLIFIRAEYVDEYQFDEKERSVSSSLVGNSFTEMSNYYYTEYPY